MQSELKLVKEFRRRRAQMEMELEGIRENLQATNKDHADTLQQLQRKVWIALNQWGLGFCPSWLKNHRVIS